MNLAECLLSMYSGSFVHVQWMKGFNLNLLTSLDSDLMSCRLTFTSATNNNACTMNTVLRQKSNC